MSDRTSLPHDLPTEKALLGSLLLVSAALDEVRRIVSAAAFYLECHQKIFAAMIALADRGVENFDTLIVANELARTKDQFGRSDLEDIGGPEYLQELLQDIPHAAHAKYYASTVQNLATQRSLIYAGRQIVADAFEGEEQDAAELIAKAADTIQKIAEVRIPNRIGVKEEIDGILEDLDADRMPGLMTGFRNLDQMTGGLRPGTLNILAARTSVGKTAFSLNICRHVAEAGTPVLFESLEMQRREILSRLLTLVSCVNGIRIRDRSVDSRDRADLQAAAGIIAQWPLIIDDEAGQTVQQIASTARWMRSRNGLGLVIVDYLQLLRTTDQRANREQQVATISRDLKSMAKQLDVPVIALCQLSRAVETRESKRPRLSDLRESGAIEQDADIVAFLNRPCMHDLTRDVREMELIIAKHRAGECGDVLFDWDAGHMRFTEETADDCGFTPWDEAQLPEGVATWSRE